MRRVNAELAEPAEKPSLFSAASAVSVPKICSQSLEPDTTGVLNTPDQVVQKRRAPRAIDHSMIA